MAEVGGDAVAFGLRVEGVPVGAVDAAVLADDGGDDVHRAVQGPDRGPPAAVRVAFRGEAGRGDQTLGDVGPLGVSQIRVARVGAHRAQPHRPLGRPGADPCGRGVQDTATENLLRIAEEGELLTRSAIVGTDQPGPQPVAGVIVPVEGGNQCGSGGGALQVGDHGVPSQAVGGARRAGWQQEDPQIGRFGPAGDRW